MHEMQRNKFNPRTFRTAIYIEEMTNQFQNSVTREPHRFFSLIFDYWFYIKMIFDSFDEHLEDKKKRNYFFLVQIDAL